MSGVPASFTVGVAVPKFTPQIVSCRLARSASARRMSGIDGSARATPPRIKIVRIPTTTAVIRLALVMSRLLCD
jgi:hypothetical protein